MAVEIEHKFLLRDDRWRQQAQRSTRMRQGYLTSNARCSVRVRVADGEGVLNLKSGTLGIQRTEYDYPIPLAEAEEILDTLCEKPLLEKTRHFVPFGDHLWEIDEFEGDNAGLIVAEVELAGEAQTFSKPDWAGTEVTGDTRYFNSNLSRQPFKQWRK